MRKSGWAVAAGFGSLALLLTACGSSSSPTAASTSAPQSSAASSSSAGQPSTSAASSSPATAPASTNPGTSAPSSHAPSSHAAQPAASGAGPNPFENMTVMIVQKSNLGYVLAEANGQVVYTYAHDTKGGTPTCTGSCSDVWVPVTGVPKAALGENFPGAFGLVARSDGTKQMTYNGYPLYTLKGAFPLTTHPKPGVWSVVPLSAADLT
jgi:predicted lipoprotein with Yx(FWY)xxD motif